MRLKDFPPIENIIFDLGNVIINLDIPATHYAFVNLFGKNHDAYMSELTDKGVFIQYEKGEITSEQFIKELSSYSDSINKEAISKAWNAMLLDIPEERFELLNTIKKDYRTFCLSNTNELHIDFIYNQLEETKNLENLDPYFERVYLSHEMGMRKPDVEIFQKVIDDNQLIPSKTLFIDDTAGHLEGARKAGLQTFHMTANTNVSELFE